MLRQTVRSLLRTPSFTLVALCCLALGIGATTCMFSIVNAVLLKPLPYRQPKQLVRVYTEFPRFQSGVPKFWVSPPEYFELRRAKSFSQLGAWVTAGVNVSQSGHEPVRVTAGAVTASLLDALDVAPILGRKFLPSDDQVGAPLTALISANEWKGAFASDPHVVGRRIYVDSQPATIVGVMPPTFAFPPAELDLAQIWIPLQLDRNSTAYANHFLNLLGRLAPGVTLQQARQELVAMTREIGRGASNNHHALDAKDHPVSLYGFHSELVGGVERSMYVLLGAVAFVLLIACVNVANLLLARSEGRQKEIAVRRAIGASARRLLLQFLVEGLILAGVGAVLGSVVAVFGADAIARLNPGSLPVVGGIAIDWRVLLFTAVFSALCGIVFGFAPMLQVSAVRIFETLKENSGRSHGSAAANRFRAALVIGQVSLSFVLVAGAGLMINAFTRLQSVNAGFEPDHLLTAEVSLPQLSYGKPEQAAHFVNRLEEAIQHMPGASSATVAIGLPPVRTEIDNDTEIEGFVPVPNGPRQNVAFYQAGGDEFAKTLGARIMQGRDLEPQDADLRHPGVLVNNTMARTFWPNEQSVLGRRIRPSLPGLKETPWFAVVGVVADIKNAGVDHPTGTEVIFPARIGLGVNDLFILVRTPHDPYAVAGEVRRIVQGIDASLPVAKVQSMQDVMASSNARPRFLTFVIGMFSVLALTLAAIGIYGLISYSVAQRVTELGIRMALGAAPGSVWWLVVRNGLGMTVAGCFFGAVMASFCSKVLAGMIFGIQSQSIGMWVAAAGIMLGAAIVACSAPALRAARVDPMKALRS